MKPATQIALNIEQKQLLQDALQRTQQAIATLEAMRSPRIDGSWIDPQLDWAEGLVASYEYLLSLPELKRWHVSSWVPQVASLEHSIKVIQELFAETEEKSQ
jgi:hypothetical protein